MNVPCWLVWKSANDGGRPFLVAIDTTNEKALAHKRMMLEQAEMLGLVININIEESKLDHLYGESIGR